MYLLLLKIHLNWEVVTVAKYKLESQLGGGWWVQ